MLLRASLMFLYWQTSKPGLGHGNVSCPRSQPPAVHIHNMRYPKHKLCDLSEISGPAKQLNDNNNTSIQVEQSWKHKEVSISAVRV